MTSTLLRSQTVMNLEVALGPPPLTDAKYGLAPSDFGVVFVYRDESGSRRSLSMEYDAWDDMGRPNEITVTIEPGDRLN